MPLLPFRDRDELYLPVRCAAWLLRPASLTFGVCKNFDLTTTEFFDRGDNVVGLIPIMLATAAHGTIG